MSSQQELSDDEVLAYARMPEWYFAVICAEGEVFRVVVLDLPGLEVTGRTVADAMDLANRTLMERADETIRAGGAFPAPSHPDDLKEQHPDYFVHPWQGTFLPSPGGLRPVQISEEEFRIKHGNFIANSLRKKMRATTQADASPLAPLPATPSEPADTVEATALASLVESDPAHERRRRRKPSSMDGGVTKAEILAVFTDPIRGQTKEQWKRMLGDVPGWLKEARIDAGGKSIQSRWNPAKLAMCLAEKGYMGNGALGSLIRRDFPEYLPEWEAYAGSFERR